MFYSSDADGLRAFLRDKLGFKANDTGDGWLIFDLPEADMGVHPASKEDDAPSGMSDISFFCDDIWETVEELKTKGVKFRGDVQDRGWGLVTQFHMPGDIWATLYQPRY
jgi:hypothetical protein